MPTDNKEIKITKREISAGFIIYRRTTVGTKFLLLYHGHNYWNFPKGHIESEEGSLEAAFRETQEETGLGKNDLRLMTNFKAQERFFFRKQNQPIFKIVIFYLAETKNRNVKVSEEHQGYAWFLPGEAKKILGKYRDSQKVFKQAYDFIQRAGARRGPQNPPRPNPNLQAGSHPRRPAPSLPGSR